MRPDRAIDPPVVDVPSDGDEDEPVASSQPQSPIDQPSDDVPSDGDDDRDAWTAAIDSAIDPAGAMDSFVEPAGNIDPVVDAAPPMIASDVAPSQSPVQHNLMSYFRSRSSPQELSMPASPLGVVDAQVLPPAADTVAEDSQDEVPISVVVAAAKAKGKGKGAKAKAKPLAKARTKAKAKAKAQAAAAPLTPPVQVEPPAQDAPEVRVEPPEVRVEPPPPEVRVEPPPQVRMIPLRMEPVTVPPPPKAPASFARFAVDAPPPPAASVFCNWCGNVCKMACVRVTSKSQAKFKCGRCNSTFVKMNAEFGKWPTEDFLKISDEDQTDFYDRAAKESSAKVIAKLVVSVVEKYKTEENSWAFGGKFLPLPVLKVKGFDIDMLVANSGPDDVEYNVQCGPCYRVKLKETYQRGSEGKRTFTSMTASSGTDIGSNKHPRIENLNREEESKAEFTQRMKTERDQRKLLEKSSTQKKLVAAQLTKKLTGPIESLAPLLVPQATRGVPEHVMAEAKAKHSEAASLQDQLNACVSNPDKADFDPETKKEVLQTQ